VMEILMRHDSSGNAGSGERHRVRIRPVPRPADRCAPPPRRPPAGEPARLCDEAAA
jgi:hypothetical protein